MRLHLPLLLVLSLSSCGTSLAQKAHYANEAAHQLTKVVGKQLNNACLAKAVTCKEEGILSPGNCKPLKDCRVVRDTFYHAVEMVHIAVVSLRVKKALSVEDVDDIESALKVAQRALEEAYKVALDSGLIGGMP